MGNCLCFNESSNSNYNIEGENSYHTKDNRVEEHEHSDDIRNSVREEIDLSTNIKHGNELNNGLSSEEAIERFQKLQKYYLDDQLDIIEKTPECIQRKVIPNSIKEAGYALWNSDSQLKADRDIVLEAVKKNGKELRHAGASFKEDKEIVLEAVKQNGYALRHAGASIKEDKEIVLEAVRQNGYVLIYAAASLKKDKDIVLQAVKQYGNALKHAAASLKEDKYIVLEAVKQDGDALQYADATMKEDIDIVKAAVLNRPGSIKFAAPKLTQDPEILKIAKLWDIEFDTSTNKHMIVMSTRFSLGEKSSPQATIFGSLMRQNKCLDEYSIYHPNAWNKCSCDPNWTNFSHKCRGTKDTCTMVNADEQGKPTKESCWRFSYRYQLEKARESGGFVVQLVEYSWYPKRYHELGKGQLIEVDLAAQVGIKLFQVFEPYDNDNYEKDDVDKLVEATKDWKAGNYQDMKVTRVGKFIENDNAGKSNIHRVPEIYQLS